jgi:multicomponent Na+:H+ antiporter subunit B
VNAAFITTLLCAVALIGLSSLLHRSLWVSVILLSVFSFLSALLLYVAHAPDVAITEAAVGAGMTTLIFVWAVRATASPAGPDWDEAGPDGAGPDEAGPDEAGLDKAGQDGAGIETEGRDAAGRPAGRRKLKAGADLLLVLAVGVLLLLFLPPLEGGPELMREHLLANGYEDTGAFNLVSAIYLGYRAFDTFGETIVLLTAVSAALFFLSREH